jgi:hypothetical protein
MMLGAIVYWNLPKNAVNHPMLSSGISIGYPDKPALLEIGSPKQEWTFKWHKNYSKEQD